MSAGSSTFARVFVALAAVCLAASPAFAQGNGVVLDAQSRAIVEQLTLDRAATIAALQRRADERETPLLATLAERDRALRQTLAAASSAQREREAASAELARVTAQRHALIQQIASRDSQFAAEVAEYRRQIASIAASPDPRKRAALARYAAGDRQGAVDALIDIQNAETAAIAAGWRDIAQRALQQYERRELALEDAIEIVDRAARIADTDRELWRSLGGLLTQAGRTQEASAAYARAGASTAPSTH